MQQVKSKWTCDPYKKRGTRFVFGLTYITIHAVIEWGVLTFAKKAHDSLRLSHLPSGWFCNAWARRFCSSSWTLNNVMGAVSLVFKLPANSEKMKYQYTVHVYYVLNWKIWQSKIVQKLMIFSLLWAEMPIEELYFDGQNFQIILF